MRGPLHQYFRGYLESVFHGKMPPHFEDGFGLELLRLTFMAGARSHQALQDTAEDRAAAALELKEFHKEITIRSVRRADEEKEVKGK
jgi:hypothetical protein